MTNPGAYSDPADALLAQQEQFKAFLIARVGNVEDAEDILQNGLVKALQRAGDLEDKTKLTAWFYQLLRHAVVDHVRSRQSAASRELAWVAAKTATAAQDETAICRCFEAIIASMKPKPAALLRMTELEGRPVAEAATALGITPNAASVALHRARAELRSKLEAFCRDCAKTSCLNCDCGPISAPESVPSDDPH